jgi:hypothetical protein
VQEALPDAAVDLLPQLVGAALVGRRRGAVGVDHDRQPVGRNPAREHGEQLAVGRIGRRAVAHHQGRAGWHDRAHELRHPVRQPERTAGRGDQDSLVFGEGVVERCACGGHRVAQAGRHRPDLDIVGGDEVSGTFQGDRDQMVQERRPHGVGAEATAVPVDDRHQQRHSIPPVRRCTLDPQVGPVSSHPLWMTLEVPASFAVPGFRMTMRFMVHLSSTRIFHHYSDTPPNIKIYKE